MSLAEHVLFLGRECSDCKEGGAVGIWRVWPRPVPYRSSEREEGAALDGLGSDRRLLAPQPSCPGRHGVTTDRCSWGGRHSNIALWFVSEPPPPCALLEH